MTARARNLFDLSGKVAIVSGGAHGIGRAICSALASHGATTVLFDIELDAAQSAAHEIAKQGEKNIVEALECDVADRRQVAACVERVVKHYGGIDALVNNAGIHRRIDPTDVSQDDLDPVLRVNLLGSLYLAGAVGKQMIEQRSGSIINISALGGGLMGLGRGGSIYGISKGGLVALTRDLAAEWGKYSVRVNALAPGWIRTRMTASLQQHGPRSAKVMQRVPLRRWGEPEDVAGAAVFLASDASRYVTGHTIPIDGGAANVISLADD